MGRLFAILVALLASGIWESAQAQNPFAVARKVNTSIITNYDISQRIKLLSALGVRAPEMRELALKQLTEDRLKEQAAKAAGMSLPEDAIDDVMENFAKQRQMSVGALRSTTRRAGVDPMTLDDFVRVGVLWRDLVNLRFRSRATPTEADIETILNYAASSKQESVFIREIAIPFAERGNQGARDLADRIIRDVNNGASFSALARQYSRTPTAANGGAVGWTPANRLPPAIAGQILTLSKGEMTAPIEVQAGIIVIQLADIREEANDNSTEITASYIRLDVPITDTPEDANARAATLIDDLDGCTDAEARISEFGPASGRFGPDPLATIPADVSMALAGLDADEATSLQPSDAGVSVIVLCRRAATTDPEAITNLQNQVFSQRMGNYASSFIQELLADAIIEDK